MVPTRLLDLTRLVSRLGRGPMTGIDRVECAYLTHLASRETPLFGLVRSGAGWLLLDQPGCARFAQIVSGKVGFNGFSGTQLDQVLRDRGIKRVLLAGMVTSLCIDSTGRAAYERGYSVTVLSDCTSSRTATEQEFFCSTVFPLYGEVMSGKEVLAGAQMTVAV